MEEKIKKVYRIALASYYSMFASAILVAFIGFKISRDSFNFNEEITTAISTLSIIFLVVSIPLILWLYNQKITKITTIHKDVRYSFYIKWIKIRIFTVGFGLLINILLFYLFHSYSFLYAAGISAVAMLFCKPNKNTIENELTIIEEDTEISSL